MQHACSGATLGEISLEYSSAQSIEKGIASLEDAVAELQVPAILVMGHSGCGAVKAALSTEPISSPLLRSLVDQIRSNIQAKTNLEQAVQANTKATDEQIRSRSALLSEAIKTESATIKPTYFDINTGTVRSL
jgi:carbonic anhydrase